ncbi:GNAT family N-acetyltransferase [Rhodocytophaga aerolata]|uniref:GNAT family N-acetyltransferase n=1 Tax=Rhodocytophaga aerolata TaxID=455078 RepID=A0ABT8R969_9BACT|nr:GNAT family N-acetyltransferase [Rhodocytophaga aerolata]MDO1448256.1 GNAT family N-acetyltransferase [Rhodocytophaga aerolata]
MKPPTYECIYSKGNVRITVSPTCSPDALMLLTNTIYGTSGPRYQSISQESKIKDITHAHFFELTEDQTVVGTYCLSGRVVKIAEGTVDSFYGRLLAVNPSFAGKGYGSLLKREAVRFIERAVSQPHIFYSYLEESNSRSMRISNKENFTSIGLLEAIVFSRLYPKKDASVVQLQDEEFASLLPVLQETYKKYTLVHFDQVFYNQHYFVWKEKGKIIAGVQANPVSWRIVDMPGIGGKLIMHVLPHIPVLKQLINPVQHRFLALEALFVQPGYNHVVIPMLESVLHHFQVSSALYLLDTHSPLMKQLKESGKLGIMNSLKQHIHTHVMAKTNGISIGQLKQYPDQPIYTSAFDYT